MTEPLEQRISTTRRIAAPAARIFAVISDPDGHVAIDGSGMLMAADGSRRLTAVGDMFIMNMDREPLGDLPMGKYTVQNTVVAFTPEAAIAWQPGEVDGRPLGHTYGYTLTPVGTDTTEVTSYCDWSGVHPKILTILSWPVVPLSMLETSLDNLQRLVEERE
ncbi:SRPBCC family protein [Cryptosporangium aurantiacum]|uniref:Polyketide cyclase / dehydrase and lipid transport n=1 Tax=Cryptosporangium aurantiacum TaxID=134849 RepID=A0A1M7RKP1_9ACTN|nr:SRPBCC family protein [Cryptosporangium aurantiacum]SHN46716.1 Polyketide cyclase / dehydrase and lipid transport [Cryptosporangium aurantiacum]